MKAFTLPSGHEHHFRERAFKGSFIISFGIHALILVVTGSMTLFKMSGTTYAPSYTVDLVSLPSTAPAPVPAAKTTPPAPSAKPKPAPEKKVAKPAEPTPEPSVRPEEIKPSGGDEAARLERRRRIEELELQARQLYESFTSEEDAGAQEGGPPAEATAAGPPVTGSPGGRDGAPASIRFRAYYDRIWAQIRSSWVLPEGVTSSTSLVTVVGIRIAADGEIEQFWIEKKSGNDYYDQSALRAIRKANPLPPLPEELSSQPLEVGINFRYPE